jgi:hypothetical protein
VKPHKYVLARIVGRAISSLSISQTRIILELFAYRTAKPP